MTDEQILKQFHSMQYGIFTMDRALALGVIEHIIIENIDNVNCLKNSQYDLELILKDGTIYRWIKPVEYSRGYKMSGAYIDRNIDEDAFYDIVEPICWMCRKNNVKIIGGDKIDKE